MWHCQYPLKSTLGLAFNASPASQAAHLIAIRLAAIVLTP